MQKYHTYHHKLSQWHNPEKIFSVLFANEPHSFWLDSSLTNETNRFSYMGTSTEIISYNLKTNTTTITKNNKHKTLTQDIFSYLDHRLKEHPAQDDILPFPFIGGFVGYFGYELKALTEAKQNRYQSPFADSLWFAVKNIIVFDHQEKKMYLVSLENKSKAEKWFAKVTQTLSHRNPERHAFDPQNDKNEITFHLNRSHQQYLKDIATCKKYLQKGDSYQICLTNTITTKTIADPLAIYMKLRHNNPAPYAAYIRCQDLVIISSSPEEFLKIEHSVIETKPMKGTIKRGRTSEEDKKLLNQLATSKKDWSENAMIVDLLRNDLGKICEFGSVNVTKLIAVETYQTVHTLVSTITGTIRKNTSLIDSIKSCFPGGSMTGAPKIRAMKILEGLEKKPRGIYSGALGFLGYNQTAQLSIVIRTIIMKGSDITIGAGGAILMDSDPEKEYQEMILKAEALMKVVQKI